MACKVCLHPELENLEQELSEGVSFSRVARRYCCGRYAVQHHCENCLPEELKNQRFNVLRKRMEDQIAREARRIVKKLPREMAKDLLETLESGGKPHSPHKLKCGTETPCEGRAENTDKAENH